MSSKNSDANSNNTGTIIEEKIELKKPSFWDLTRPNFLSYLFFKCI